jgi:hypothetical protein
VKGVQFEVLNWWESPAVFGTCEMRCRATAMPPYKVCANTDSCMRNRSRVGCSTMAAHLPTSLTTPIWRMLDMWLQELIEYELVPYTIQLAHFSPSGNGRMGAAALARLCYNSKEGCPSMLLQQGRGLPFYATITRKGATLLCYYNKEGGYPSVLL